MVYSTGKISGGVFKTRNGTMASKVIVWGLGEARLQVSIPSSKILDPPLLESSSIFIVKMCEIWLVSSGTIILDKMHGQLHSIYEVTCKSRAKQSALSVCEAKQSALSVCRQITVLSVTYRSQNIHVLPFVRASFVHSNLVHHP